MSRNSSNKSPSLRRIQADIRELALDPSDQYYAAPLENDMFEWHFTIKGAIDTDFYNGIYHGRILLPPDYPFKPPHIIFMTPSGRFETNIKICLSFSAYHPELWQPAWGIRLILEALISFLPSPADGAIGSLDYTSNERKALAKQSQKFVCPVCGPICTIIPATTIKKKSATSPSSTTDGKSNNTDGATKLHFSKQIEELKQLQLLSHPKEVKDKDTKESMEATKMSTTSEMDNVNSTTNNNIDSNHKPMDKSTDNNSHNGMNIDTTMNESNNDNELKQKTVGNNNNDNDTNNNNNEQLVVSKREEIVHVQNEDSSSIIDGSDSNKSNKHQTIDTIISTPSTPTTNNNNTAVATTTATDTTTTTTTVPGPTVDNNETNNNNEIRVEVVADRGNNNNNNHHNNIHNNPLGHEKVYDMYYFLNSFLDGMILCLSIVFVYQVHQIYTLVDMFLLE